MPMRRTLVLLLAIGLAGCAGDYETFQPPPLDFGDRPPLRFAVGAVDVRSAYEAKGRRRSSTTPSRLPRKPRPASSWSTGSRRRAARAGCRR
jgi:hypothetical protein